MNSRPSRPRRARGAQLAALALALAAATSARAGINDLQGTKPGDLPLGGKFLDADGCALCHGGGYMGDFTFLPSDTWAGTMMANAARDPVFFAALTVANQDAPGVGTYCLRCHTPIGFVRGHAAPSDGSALDATDRQGVGCEVCHRAAPSPAPNNPYFIGDAQLVFTTDEAKRGPYADAASPSHKVIADDGLESAAFCGQCHQVTNPERHLRDETGADLGVEFPLDTTYEEWSSSDFGAPGASYKTCVDCHMIEHKGSAPVATPLDAKLRPNPREHSFAGGNVWGIEAVMAANPARASAYPYAFQRALERTKATLAAAVKVTIQGSSDVVLPGNLIDVTARVENLTGHKFPTGYAESRRAWLAVSLIDGSGNEQALVGGYDEATGAIVGGPDTRVYRCQPGRFTGAGSEAEEHLVMHDRILSDTRIPPAGFVPSITTMPIGDIDYKDGAGGYRSYDEATFALAPPADAAGALTLSVRVYYQSMTREHLEALRTANVTDGAGEALNAIYEATGRAAPILIASAEAPIYIGVPTGAGGGAASGGGAGGAAAAGGAGGAAAAGGAAGAGGARDGGGSGGGCDCATPRGGASPEGGGALAMLVGALYVLRAARAGERRATASGTPRPGGGAPRRGSARSSPRGR